MLGAAAIVFRETLEAALIISIVAVATVGLARRARWLAGGVAAGIVGSLAVALMTSHIAEMADGVGQEIFNAAVLGLAVAMLAWHNLWMARHGTELARQAKQLGGDVASGVRAMPALTIVVALAVLREGAETVLFLYGMLLGDPASAASVALGGAAGLAAGMLVGYGLYAGLVRVPLRWFFSLTSILVLLLTAAMASQSARYLVAADLLPTWGDPLWDSSFLLDAATPLGRLLHVLIGYEAQPLGVQVFTYVATLCLIAIGMRRLRATHS